ncbi:MAG: hypothetical protein ACYDG2_11110 [Ruminiclostridium sp.]
MRFRRITKNVGDGNKSLTCFRERIKAFKDDGYSFGKLIGLTVSYQEDEAYYELLIDRVYKTPGDNIYGLNYWKNVNFIMNMNERTFETFPPICHPYDLKRAISNSRDRYIICQRIMMGYHIR